MSRLERLAPLTGALSIVLLAVGTIVINQYEYLPAPADIADFYADNSTTVAVGASVGVVAAFFLLWFAGSVRVFLRRAESDGRLSAVAFGGGVAAASLMVISYGLTMVAAARAGSDSGISEVGAATLYDIGAAIFVPGAAMGLAAMIGAFSIVALRTAVAPRWLAWVGIILTIGSVTPLAFIFIGIGALWVFGVSLFIFRRSTAPGGGGSAV